MAAPDNRFSDTKLLFCGNLLDDLHEMQQNLKMSSAANYRQSALRDGHGSR